MWVDRLNRTRFIRGRPFWIVHLVSLHEYLISKFKQSAAEWLTCFKTNVGSIRVGLRGWPRRLGPNIVLPAPAKELCQIFKNTFQSSFLIISAPLSLQNSTLRLKRKMPSKNSWGRPSSANHPCSPLAQSTRPSNLSTLINPPYIHNMRADDSGSLLQQVLIDY